jgi:hypothetical protein
MQRWLKAQPLTGEIGTNLSKDDFKEFTCDVVS